MRSVIAVVLLSLVAAACGVDGSLSDRPGDRLIRVHPNQTGGGMGALVTGVVEVDLEVGCVWLTDRSGGRYPVVWPVGATASVEPFEIRLSDGQVVHEGDGVQGGGGYVPASTAVDPPFPDEFRQLRPNHKMGGEAEVGHHPIDAHATTAPSCSSPRP